METSYGGTSFTQIFLVLGYFVRCVQTHFASTSSAWDDMYIEILSAFSNLNFLERNMSPNNVKLWNAFSFWLFKDLCSLTFNQHPFVVYIVYFGVIWLVTRNILEDLRLLRLKLIIHLLNYVLLYIKKIQQLPISLLNIGHQVETIDFEVKNSWSYSKLTKYYH